MPGEDYQSWSTTAINNGNADSSITWVEGQERRSVNNSSRSLMAAHAKNRNLLNGSIVTGGAANAQTFTSGVGYTTVPTGLVVKLKVGAGLTNTAGVSLDMDGLGAVTVKTALGDVLLGGEFIAGSYVDLLFDGTNWIFLYSREFIDEQLHGGGGVIIGTQVFAVAGVFTFTPSPGAEAFIIECCGGGGGAGDAAASPGNLLSGGGGGSGGYSRKTATATDVGVSQTVTVGAGGAGGVPGAAGGVTSFGTLCVANGGGGGTSTLDGGTSPLGGLGGAPGTGDIVAAGNPGEQGGYVLNMTGASLGPYVIPDGGRGGSSYFGGGAQIPAVGLTGSVGGVNAGNYGSGGSGAVSNQAGGYLGAGHGSSGLVLVTEFAGRGAPGRDGAPGPQGPVGAPGPAGVGTGDVLVTGTPVAGQLAEWVDTSHIRGVAVPTPVAYFTTGDAKLTLKTVADAGWVMMNDGTIGSATSGAAHANADAQALFTLLFNNISDTYSPMYTSAGVATNRAAFGNSAATAWTANSRASLTRQLGRALAIAGAGSGLTSRGLGQYLGEEAHAQTSGEMAAHAHSAATTSAYVYTWGTQTITFGSGEPNVLVTVNANGIATTTGVSVGTSGAGTPANVMQPTAFWNIMIKL